MEADGRLRFYRVILWLETAWLIIFGFILLAYVRSNQLKLLLTPGWAWIMVAGGVASILVGTVVLLMGKKQEERYVRECCRTAGPTDPIYRTAGLLMLVGIMVLGLVLPGRTLTAGLQKNTDLGGNPFLEGTEKDFEIVKRKEPKERNVRDWMTLFSKDPNPENYRGEEVRLTGVAWRDEDTPAGDFYLLRYLFSHCIACAQPLLIMCRVQAGEVVPEVERWVTVEGMIATDEFDGKVEPFVEVERYKVISQPEDPYIYK